jgi:hypothetical protein
MFGAKKNDHSNPVFTFHNLCQTLHFSKKIVDFFVKSALKIASTAAFSVHLSEYIFTTPN